MSKQHRKPLARAIAALALIGQSFALGPLPTALAQTPDEEAIVDATGQPGRHFRQTGAGTGLGYDVREPFFSAMTALGGPTATGFPVSTPFQGVDGCLYQAFQVVLLQQCAGGPVARANTFQILEENGADERLNQLGIGPGQSDPGATFEQAKANRLAWLEDAAIRERYLSQCGNGNPDAAVEFCGLPMNQPRSFGPFISQRFQRIAFQRWTVDGPGGITAGQVTASLGGDLLKDTGVLTGAPVQPHLAGQPPAVAQIAFNRVGSAAPATGQTGATFRDRATLGIVASPVEAAAAAAPTAFAAGREGQELAVGDVVRAPGTGHGLLTYFQGTTSEVTPGTTLVVTQLAQSPQGGFIASVRQTAGQAVHRIGQLLTGGSFTVQTPNATAVVRGTILRTTILPDGRARFEVWDAPATITVGNQSVTIQPGQLTETQANGQLGAPANNSNPPPPPTPPATGGASAATPAPTATAAATPTVAPQQRTTPLGVGFQGDFYRTALRPDSIQKIKDSGAGWAKQQVLWDQLEIDQATCQSIRPYNASSNVAGCMELIPGRYFRGDQITFLEAVVRDLAGGGLRVMLSVVRAPSFVAAAGGHAPGDPERLGQFLTAILSRPEIKGRVQAVEPWNEQNLSWEWGADRLWPNRPNAPPQGAVDFVNLQKAAYRAIKAVDGGITVVLPALTPTGLAECWESEEARTQGFCLDAMRVAIDDRLYLDFMYRVNNGEIRSFYDVLGVHPSGYNNPPTDWVDRQTVPQGTGFKGHGSFYIRRYEQLRAVQLKYGDSKPMWFTEVGWTVTRSTIPGYEYGRDNTEDARGKYFGQMLEMLNREAPYVTQVFVWNLNFRQVVGENDEKYGFGVLNSDGSATPAYTCIQDFARDATINSAACR
ncbi:MAG TPA: hypothetical protein VFN74_06005 [Chloroflexota bacterium]|nr:hypothetical protein [Chloroflexota bacterium]